MAQYETTFSAMIGAQINQKKYENSNYGPWERCKAVVFFLGAYAPQPDEDPNQPATWNTMIHFIAYVKGAADIA